MALPPKFADVLTLLGRAFEEYQRISGARAVLVGDAAVCLFTDGGYVSGDFDVVAASNDVLDLALANQGFRKEDRSGRIRRGYYHPKYPQYGIDSVSGALFDGLSDPHKLRVVTFSTDSKVTVASVEDLIADRLGQYAASNNLDRELLEQARLLKSLARQLDTDYLCKRILDDGGDPSLIGDSGE